MNSIYTPDVFMAIEASATSATNLEWFVNRFFVQKKKPKPRTRYLCLPSL